ncbi:MAG: prepilin-type N-terminal cleavage/methylation domain-containing protein [Elusimicrobia bacterium]|mgnify:CR=1 FL=1|nr:prepilin-type N-terminal cleavage/methylation domain-containing protein [Elusimicrobiota bacterium]
MVKRTSGYTLVELLVVSAIVAFLLSMGASLFTRVSTFFRVSIAKMETQRDVRNLMDLVCREIRQAKSSSITLSREDASQPPYSKISFQKVQGDTILFWQTGRTLSMSKNGATTVLSKKLRSILFSYPFTADSSLLTILLSIEKTGGNYETYSLQMGGETIRLLNN